MRTGNLFIIGLAFCSLLALAAKKKNPDDFTQTLALPKEPPAVAEGDTSHLVFHVSPLSSKGLLSQQTRDALKAILKETGSLPVIHIRAFVAGSGDLRRVPQIVSEVFTEKKMALPSVSVVLSGGLPLENAQVILETVSLSRKEANPAGLSFATTAPMISNDPSASAEPLLAKSLDDILTRAKNTAPLRVTCFVSNLAGAAAMTSALSDRFPGAAIDLVQAQRAPYQASAQCEGIFRGGPVTAKLAFTGTRVAFSRLDRDLTEAGTTAANIVFGNIYALSSGAGTNARKLRPPDEALAVIPVEAIASIDAGFAVDAIATIP